jgi:beta-N-acetylhexosaminidase
MQALQKVLGTRDASLQSLQAGIDMLCIGNNLLNQELKIVDIGGFHERGVKAEH